MTIITEFKHCALENFNLTNSKVGNFPNLIKALAMVKLACAEANYNLKT